MSEQTQESRSSAAVQRARADLAAGREWKARDRLVGHVATEYDAEGLELLGEVHFAMRDLPSAGAVWFGTGRRGQDVDDAVAAWRERHRDHFAEMWRSLPRSVREHRGNKRVDALRRKADEERAAAVPESDVTAPPQIQRRVDAAMIIAVGLAVLFVVCAVVGFVTLVRWIIPG